MITKETKYKALATALRKFDISTFGIPRNSSHIYFFGHVACRRREHFFHYAPALFCLSIYLLLLLLFQVCAKKYKQAIKSNAMCSFELKCDEEKKHLPATIR